MQGNRAIQTARGSKSKCRFLQDSSIAALALVIGIGPAHAQLARARANLGVAPVVVTPQNATTVRPVVMREALARSLEHQVQVDGIRGVVLEAQRAAIAALRNTALPPVRDGLTGADGSNADAGLDPVRTGVRAALDPTGVNTWQGANLPTQVDANGAPVVTIVQTDDRAILTWNRFDVGANTTVNFVQKQGDVAQPGWIALNRVANSTAPSRILGAVNAEGTVAVINSRGIVFEKGSQLNLYSLLVSSLEIGNFATRREEPIGGGLTRPFLAATTIADRNATFLQSGFQTLELATVTGLAGQTIAPQLTSSLLSFPSISVGSPFDAASFLDTPVEGAITIDSGATINASRGGFIIATAPTVSNSGVLNAIEGQVSLQAGRGIAYALSTGSATSTDVATGVSPDVRGITLRTWYGLNGSVTNAGLIEVPRGYISLGAGEGGVITNSGLLAATTSVSRNAKISLTGGTITLAGNTDRNAASGIVVTADTNGETIPIGTADAPPPFRSTQIEIGNVYLARQLSVVDGALVPAAFGPASVLFGANSILLAPNANVVVGGTYIDPQLNEPAYLPPSLGNIDVEAGAILDVSGIKDLPIDASRNSLEIDPLKRNELRDTPTYRETTTDGSFSLNGATVYVDPRLSGVRADGVAWVGSPLLEAGSAASQILVTAAELMTRAGNISLSVAVIDTVGGVNSSFFVAPNIAPRINIDSAAVIDFSGGWVRYGDGAVRSSRLLTADGRIIEIGDADPNDEFVAVGDGFTEIQSRFAISRTYANALLQGGRREVGYDEGRDAGSLNLTGSVINLDGTIFGNAFAGGRQTTSGIRPSRTSSLASDPRQLQATALQLPSNGWLGISSGYDVPGSLTYGADIVVARGDPAAIARPTGQIALSDSMLSGIGLSGLSLFTTGRVTFNSDSQLALENGGAISVVAGRTITFDGRISAPSGSIEARTTNNQFGSAFQVDDDRDQLFQNIVDIPNLFDINVGGTLSVAGLWTNDFGRLTGETLGAGFIDGGSVTLTSAPRIFGFFADPAFAADLSGSINIADAALIDVSSGGYVAPNGSLQLSARGGNVSLINRTAYALALQTPTSVAAVINSRSDNTQTVAFSPTRQNFLSIVPQVLPINPDAEVRFSASSLKGFGFSGGGTFTLVAPTIAMGSDVLPNGPGIGLDFLQRTGFGTLDLSANRSRIVPNLFNGVSGNSAFLETSIFRVADGETLDLTQWVRSPFIDSATAARLTGVQTGGDISFLTPVIPDAAFDRTPATLRLGGLTELDVEAGGSITGAAGATLNVSKLLNEGTIRIAGGSILQQFSALPQVSGVDSSLTRDSAFGVRDIALGGNGLDEILGGRTANGSYNQDDLTSAPLFGDASNTTRITNGDVFRTPFFDRTVYFLGRLDAEEGLRFGANSVTDLSGTALFNPRAPLLQSGQIQVTGRILDGGTIQTGSIIRFQQSSSPLPASFFAQTLNALPGAVIDLSGTVTAFDEAVSPSAFGRVTQWSDGGRLSLLSGGTLSGATIRADGGAPQATGGVLEWLNPVIRQSGNGARADDILFASQLGSSSAGFDTIIAYNGFTADGVGGAVNLALDKAFVVSTSLGSSARVAGGSSFTVTAPFVTVQQTSAQFFSDDRRSTLLSSQGAGTLTFDASRNLDIIGNVSFALPTASTAPDAPTSSVNFTSGGDIRLIGLAFSNPSQIDRPNSLNGSINANSDINFTAAQVYATTGTGNLQQLLEDRQANRATVPSPFAINSSATAGTISFLAQPGAAPSNVYSAGSYVRVRAANIVQAGTLRAPLGLLELGSNFADTFAPATESLVFAAGSVTSVSGTGRLIPYGTTTDLTDYLFTPNASQALTAPPTGALTLSGDKIDINQGATVDGRGGGEIFAYEFVSGTGGSRDVLDRLNPDVFSGNGGLQYADGRQVYALLPADRTDLVAKYDPVYSADYLGGAGGSLYGPNAGRSIILDASPGLAGGEYILLPAHYALLPGLGALRVVENVGVEAPTPGFANSLLDGSIIVGGTYATSGTGLVESQRRSFTLQTQDVFKRSSRLETTFGSTQLTTIAQESGAAIPRLPVDAARVILSPLTELKVAGLLDTSAPNGLGAQFDIAGSLIRITGATDADPVVATPGVLTLTTGTLAGLNASSLYIGGQRTDNTDGTTTLGVTASRIEIDGNVNLTAPELIFAVAGQGSTLTVNDGATLSATGLSGGTRTGDYVITSSATPADEDLFDQSGIGSVLRLSGGGERLIQRQGDFALRNTLRPSVLDIGAATLTANSVAFDTSRNFALSNDANLVATNIAISADVIQFGRNFIDPAIEAQLANASRLTLRSPDVIRFAAIEPHFFNNLRLDAPGLALVAPLGAAARLPSALEITADSVEIGNSSAAQGACTTLGVRACGRVENSITLLANDITFRSGEFRTYGFDRSVTLGAANGMFVEGVGAFVVTADTASLALNTPFLVDRSNVSDIRTAYIRPDYSISTNGALTITAPAGSVAPPVGREAPGARIALGSVDAPVASVVIDGALVRATSGIIDARSTASIALTGQAVLATPGFTKTFGDTTDSVTLSANAGTINLASLASGIDAGSASSLIVDTGTGGAGTLNLIATRGTINFSAALNPGVASGLARSSSLFIDAQTLNAGGSLFDFSTFVSQYGPRFGGDLSIRTATGNLTLNAGQELRARSVMLTADDVRSGQGLITIAGLIDTSGDDVTTLDLSDPRYTAARINGGNISLYGDGGVTLAATGELRARTAGYSPLDSRVASAGDVVLGIGRASTTTDPVAITLAAGSTIDVGTLRTGSRLVSQISKDPVTLAEIETFRYAEADKGGVVTLRAMISPADTIDIRSFGAITGARSLEIEAFRRFDLQEIGALGNFTGVSADGVRLDANATGARPNFLADIAPGTLPDFVRNFSVTAANGGSLGAFRVRPGIELNSTSDIILDSILNLGAGSITDFAAAEAAGLLVKSPLGPDADGNPRYQFVPNLPGQEFANETRLFNEFVDMTYRVGGSVAGAAPVVTFRAAGDLDVANSITDGFFAFHDRTNADYISYQLGGGNRTYMPAVLVSCGSALPNCTGGVSYADVVSGRYVDPTTGRRTPAPARLITLTTNRAQQGEDNNPFINSPFSSSVNTVGASGTGDPLGVAELFPLVNGQAADSSSIRLVAGSGGLSVNPLHSDLATPGSVFVSGEKSYLVESSVGTRTYAGTLQLRFPVTSTNDDVDLFDTDTFFEEKYGADAERAKDFYTVFSWGNGTTDADAEARASAVTFFAGATFIGTRGRETGVNARLEDVIRFLTGPNFAGRTYAENVVLGRPGYDAAALPTGGNRNFLVRRIYTGTAVRTGDGNIAVAASGDVNLLRTERPAYRTFTGVTAFIPSGPNAQVGSNAIYTAGVRADPSLPAGAAAPQSAGEAIDYVPSVTRALPTNSSISSMIATGVKSIGAVYANGGGNLLINAGGAVIGRRDVWSDFYGSAWRAGRVGPITNLVSLPEYFTSGIATLAGGDIAVRAGGPVSDLTVTLANNVFTSTLNDATTLVSLGSGNLTLATGSDLQAGRINLASGSGSVTVGGNVTSAGDVKDFSNVDGQILNVAVNYDERNLLNLRLSDAVLNIAATGSATIGGISAFNAGYQLSPNDFGFYTPISAINILSNEAIELASNERVQRELTRTGLNSGEGEDDFRSVILPGSVGVHSLEGDLKIGQTFLPEGDADRPSFRENYLLYPSAIGQLSLTAGRNINDLALAMLDADPADLPGAFTVYRAQTSTVFSGLDFAFPLDGLSDSVARLTHNRRLTHLNDPLPARIFAGGSISNINLSLPKQARIGAGGDIIDLTYRGQNLLSTDITRITAGGDITTTQAVVITAGSAIFGRVFNVGNDIEVGGLGALFVEAGGDLGPFLASGNGRSGGIRTVGNDVNPWLSSEGARLYAMFGLRSPATGDPNGANYGALVSTYLDPANLALLDGDLFEQNTDSNGNQTPDRSRYVYAPILAQWLYDNERSLFTSIFGTTDIAEAARLTGGISLAEARRLVADTSLDEAARAEAQVTLTAATSLANAAYSRFADLTTAFGSIGSTTPNDPGRGRLRQQQFLLDKVYFGELAAPADPTGNSSLQYIRSYRAIETLFPASRGYTDNLATYTIDPSTIDADNPLGIAVKRLNAEGQPLAATRVRTGNADLRLSAFQTTRSGDITLIGPGGDIIAGSVVRLASQLARTAQGGRFDTVGRQNSFSPGLGLEIRSFPIGNEGILTLRGGAIRSFTDGDFRLNQSRLFSVQGGDLALFSANGDLNAGQGPISASSFPPVTVRFNPNFLSEVDSAGSVAGAGIAAFRPAPEVPASSITLIAPVGTVDAGDAGVRASGNVFVAAARVANSDNFKVGGTAFGVPSLAVATAAVPASATNAINANTFRPTSSLDDKINERLSQILVNVVGFIGGDGSCPDSQSLNAQGECIPN